MAAAVPNHEMLVWARQESGHSEERIARRLQVPVERVRAWETGERSPTTRQLQLLATFLHRPLSIFFLRQRPELPPLATEYRRLRGVRPGAESPELRLALRQMLLRRERALELLRELGEPAREFALRAHLRDEPARVAGELRATLGVSIDAQVAWPSVWRAWAGWREAVERIGVLVFQFPKVPLEECRGLALLHWPLPVAAVNGRELPDSKAFTVVHETVHLMLAAAREESSAAVDRRPDDEWAAVERFAEDVTGRVLMPDEALRELIPTLHLARGVWGLREVRTLAGRFKVTPLAAATRLRSAGYLSWDEYRRWVAEWDSYVATLPPRRGGFATPVDKALGRAGRPFAQLVVEALDANRITSVDASRYLDLRFSHFETLRSHLADRSAGAGVDE